MLQCTHGKTLRMMGPNPNSALAPGSARVCRRAVALLGGPDTPPAAGPRQPHLLPGQTFSPPSPCITLIRSGDWHAALVLTRTHRR